MSAALHALLAGSIDYAGLFPPAKLPLAEALRNHANYRAGADAWMLGRFICPAARLAELAAFEDVFQQTPGFTVSALARGGSSVREFSDGLHADLADIDACRKRHAGRIVIDTLEVRLPADYQDAFLVTRIRLGPVRGCRGMGLCLFFEIPAPTAEMLPLLLPMIGEAFPQLAGIKLRCGGLEAAAFPSSEQIALALTACLAAGVPFKATAGLHHPLPRFDPGVQARMHGFINLLTAGVLMHAGNIGSTQAHAILDDEDPTHFRLDDAGLHWRQESASLDAIQAARKEAVLSFGSCSFDEPRDDLRALGWL